MRIQVKGQQDPITVTGNATSIAVGEQIVCKGNWVNYKNYGLQFKTTELTISPPNTLDGIEKYLSSGMIKGVGAHFAKKLITAFGDTVFDVIESEPERLASLKGFGKKRCKMLLAAFAEQKIIRNIMVFLQSYGVGTARAVRIYKAYGNNAIQKVRDNPYRLARDIDNIGFKTADTIAQQLGIAKNSLIRAQAGVVHVLQELCNNGHCAVVHSQLVTASYELLEIPVAIIEEAIANEILAEHLVPDLINDVPCIYPKYLYQAELQAAEHIKRLNDGVPPWDDLNSNSDELIALLEEKNAIKLSASQQQALKTAMTSKLTIITGGPGVGKTTLINSILTIIRSKKLSIGLCAPTGRAAKRLTETTKLQAKTIHRLLEFTPKPYRFKHDSENPLPHDVLIIDESSMLDVVLLNHLLKAIPDHAAIIFVGDIDQLPSVGSGAVLSDLITSKVITTVRLTEIFRQATSSRIILNAHRVNKGEMLLPNEGNNSDFFTMYANTAEEIHDTLLEVVSIRLPQFYQCDPIRKIQVLTPMKRGGLGSHGLNIALQQALNGNSLPKITHFGMTFSPGDKVIQITNNYEKDVFNGDIGFIERINSDDGKVVICFDHITKEYWTNELDELNLAYAISIHKSQGSEFPIVVIPIVTQHFTLLARNLLYTGITRGKKAVILIAQKKAVTIAINNNKEAHRLTKLASRILS